MEENPQISLIFLRQSIGYYSAALRKTKNRILTIRKWGMYLVYPDKRLKKGKKKIIDIHFFFHCITKERASVQIYTNFRYWCCSECQKIRTMQNWYCKYRSEIFMIENRFKNVASQWNRFGLSPEVQSRRTKYFSKRKTDRMRLLTA